MEFILEQNEIREDYKVNKKKSPVIILWRSRPTKGLLFLFLFAIVVPVLIYYFVIDKGTYPAEETNTCSVNTTYRITCGKTENVTYQYCTSISCCFDNSTKLCFHYLPSKYFYFSDGKSETYQRQLDISKSPFQQELTKEVSLSINEIDENNVQIILHDINATVDTNTVSNKNYNVSIHHNPLYVEVFRSDSDELLLTTANGPTIISQDYREWSFQLTEEYLFGLGQVLIDLDKNSTLTKVIYANNNDHNTLPTFMANKNGKYHGLVVRHSGLLELTVLPSKLVSLRSLEREKIVLELSLGPTPHDVMMQQKKGKWKSVDLKTLGVHVCREGSASTLKDIFSDYKTEEAADFSYESDCFHENLVTALRKEKSTQNIDSVLDIVKNLISSGHRFMLSVPPHVSFDSALYDNSKDLDVFYKSDNKTYKGQYLKNNVVYPYFKHNSIDKYIELLLQDLQQYFKDLFPSNFILNYNWPKDDSFIFEDFETFNFLSKGAIDAMSYTLPWNVTSEEHLQILDHNDYGAFQTEKFLAALSNDTFIMTASHNVDTLHPILIQNVDISWVNFKEAIVQTLYNSISGNPLTSVPVCGSTSKFNISIHESLCVRWYLMASTAPIFRLSSDIPRRDPTSLGSTFAGSVARKAIDMRYSLIYYYYTVLNKNKEPLMRPMFYDFPDDNETFPLVDQYMVGRNLLVAHPTIPERTQITIYLPKSVGTWYEFWGGDAFGASKNKPLITLTLVETDWIGFIREGGIIPWATDDAENVDTKLVELKVALKCNTTCDAEGLMTVGQEWLLFKSTEKVLTVERSGVLKDTKTFFLSTVVLYKSDTKVKYLELKEKQNLNDIDNSWTLNYDDFFV